MEHPEPEIFKEIRALLHDNPALLAVRLDEMRKYLALVRPIVEELHELGYRIETLHDLRHQGKPWKTALPVLLRWLPKIDDPSLKEDIVRCLSVPWIGNHATSQLIQEFTKAATNRLPLAWTAGNALSIVDIGGFEKDVMALCRKQEFGSARQMLVLGLGRLRDPEAETTAIELLGDETVRLHAIIALGGMKSKRALPELEPLLSDREAAIRRESRKAIAKINR